MYAQRNVQLKKKGNFKLNSKEGGAIFSLNKNFYIDGNFYSKSNGAYSCFSKYINGTVVYSEETNGKFKNIKSVDVKLIGKDYFITKYETYGQDSVIEKYKNQKPILKEKYENRKLIIQKDIVKNTVHIYDKYGKLQEKHYNNIEEKYNDNGEVYYKKVHLEHKIEEYENGILNKVYEFKLNKDKRDVIVVTTYDEKGNVTNSKEESPYAEVAPEYMIFDLEIKEFESYKSVLKK